MLYILLQHWNGTIASAKQSLWQPSMKNFGEPPPKRASADFPRRFDVIHSGRHPILTVMLILTMLTRTYRGEAP